MTPIEVAFLAERFGWTLDTVMGLTLHQVYELQRGIAALDKLRGQGV